MQHHSYHKNIPLEGVMNPTWKSFGLAASSLCFLLVLSCTQTIVPLSYQPVAVPVSDCPQQLRVAPFEDARGDTLGIGLTARGTPFYPETFIEEWFTSSLRQQLRTVGCAVQPGAEKSSPDELLVRGTIRTASLRQHSASEYTVTLAMNLILEKQNAKIYEENFSVKLQKWVLPKAENPTLFLQEAMQELLRTAVPKLLDAAKHPS